ncbi:MAG: hypothetical protein DRG78_18475 [Epsilonproteobacteria bacterium]|nr:MAG: hypothetical protein DRG78_18475 [Campylobacterota bacterium]
MKFKKLLLSSLLAATLLQAESGEALFNIHCSSCHSEVIGVNESGGKLVNIYEAPYIKDLITHLKSQTKNKTEFTSFIKDYINLPSKRKSLYGKKAIKEFGLMPSLSGVLSDKESTAVANYLYDDYGKNNNKNKTTVTKKDTTKTSLFKQNCASCHADAIGVDEDGGKLVNIYEAPYVNDVVKKLKAETTSKEEFISFIKDYINMPSKRKSLYGKKAIKEFGLMPSLSGLLTDKESTELAIDLYENY